METGNYGLLGYIRFIPNAPELGIFINFSNQPIDVSKFTQNGKQVYSTNQLIVNESGNYLSQNSGMIWKYEEK